MATLEQLDTWGTMDSLDAYGTLDYLDNVAIETAQAAVSVAITQSTALQRIFEAALDAMSIAITATSGINFREDAEGIMPTEFTATAEPTLLHGGRMAVTMIVTPALAAKVLGEDWSDVATGSEVWTDVTSGSEVWTQVQTGTEAWLRQ